MCAFEDVLLSKHNVRNGKRMESVQLFVSSCREKLESVPSMLHQVILLGLLLCLESAKQDILNENSHDLRVWNTKLKSMFSFPLPGYSTVELTFLLLLLFQFDVWIMFLIIFFIFLLFYFSVVWNIKRSKTIIKQHRELLNRAFHCCASGFDQCCPLPK